MSEENSGGHLKRLTITDFKRVEAVDIEIDGHVVIGGENDAGKSSIFDAVQALFGGKKAIPKDPIRHGAEVATIKGEIDGEMPLTVTRRITDGRSTLSVTNPDGSKHARSQEVLDTFYNAISFDPQAFENADKAGRAAMLCRAAGIDLAEVEGQIAKRYDRRTVAKRDVKLLQAQVGGLASDSDMPDGLVDIRELAAKREALVTEAREREHACLEQRTVSRQHDEAVQSLTTAQEAVAEAEERLRVPYEKVDACRSEQDIADDNAAIGKEIAASTVANARYEAGKSRRALQAELAKATATWTAADEDVTTARKVKADMLGRINIPVEGLELTMDGDVLIKGVPFDQDSESGRIETSIAIGMALHPKLRTMLVRQASLIGPAKFKRMCETAAASKYDLWFERVGEDKFTTVVIEDGMVRPETKEAIQ